MSDRVFASVVFCMCGSNLVDQSAFVEEDVIKLRCTACDRFALVKGFRVGRTKITQAQSDDAKGDVPWKPRVKMQKTHGSAN